ncbi:MAG: MFS transporter [Chloroflexota bacterium]
MNLTIWKRIMHTQHGVALALNILLQGCLMATLAPLIPLLIAEKIGLDKTAVMLFFLINTLVGIAVTLGTGWLSDGTIARYKLVLVCGIIAAVGFVGLSQATTTSQAWLAGIAIAAIGVGFPQLFAVAKSGVVADWEQEAQVMGITALRTMFSLGFVFGTAAASLVANLDIRNVFLMIAAASVLVTFSAAVLLYRMEAHMRREAVRIKESNPSTSTTKTGYSLPVWALIVPLVALTILRGADSARGVYLPLVMLQLFKDATIAPLMFGITAAAELVAMGFMGYVASKIGEKATISIGAVVGALFYAVMSFSQSLPLLYIAHIFYAIFVAVVVGVGMAYVQNLVKNRAGLGGSLFMVVFNVGSLIGILAPLLVKDYDQTIFIAPIILCLVGAAMLMFGDRTAQIESRIQTAVAIEAGQEILVVE